MPVQFIGQRQHSPSTIMKCYFNLVNGSERIADLEGIEVKDLEQAWAQAFKAIDELRQEDDSEAEDWDSWSLEVTDSSGTLLFAINLGGSYH